MALLLSKKINKLISGVFLVVSLIIAWFCLFIIAWVSTESILLTIAAIASLPVGVLIWSGTRPPAKCAKCGVVFRSRRQHQYKWKIGDESVLVCTKCTKTLERQVHRRST